MSNVTGGVETSVQTTTAAPNNFAEVHSQTASVTGVTSIPATPTGNGWVYTPGAGTFATGNWSASVTAQRASAAGASSNYTLRFFRLSSGVYTSIGTINVVITTIAKTTSSFPATSMSTITFATGDQLYVDDWWNDTTNVGGDNPKIFVSNSVSQGVANDMQITTSSFTASAVHVRISDGYGGVFS
jgi:hypothetical protein